MKRIQRPGLKLATIGVGPREPDESANCATEPN